MLNFDQFVNESRGEERKGKQFQFSNVKPGQTVRYAASRHKVEKVLDSIIILKGNMKVNKHQWDTRNGEILEDAPKKEEKDEK